MIGYARLERIEIIVGIMPVVSEKRWTGFCEMLKPANLNPTTQDMIKRFGGSTSVEMQWPIEQEGEGDEDDRFERMEALIQKTLKRITKGGTGGKGGRGMSGSGSNSNDNADDAASGNTSSGDEGGDGG